MTKPNRQELVRQACADYPDVPSLTLARMVYKDNRAVFPNLDAARSSVRSVRGVHGSRNRAEIADKSLYREPGIAGFTWDLPTSSVKPFTPFNLDCLRVLILSDIHIPFHDRRALETAIEAGRKMNPSAILLNGDVLDFYKGSHFEQNPDEVDIKDEIDMGRQFLGYLRERFPKARIIYKLGNHDERFTTYIWRKSPELYGIPGLSLEHLLTGAIEKPKRRAVEDIEFVGDKRKITIGHLNVWHGHEVGKGFIAPVNAARGLFLRTLDCGLMGHLHKGSQHEETTSNGKLVATWSTGCLCGLHPEYARVNKWGHGAAFVELHSDRNFSVTLLRILNGKVL